MRFFLFLLLVQTALFSQETNVRPTGVRFKTAPLGLLSFYSGPNLNLSGEFDLGQRVSLNSEVLWYVSVLNFENSWKNLMGFGFKEEMRVHFKEQVSAFSYMGFEATYGQQNYMRTDIVGDGYSEPDTTVTYKTHRSFLGLVWNLGYDWKYENGLVMEIYCGAGIRLNCGSVDLSDALADGRWFGDWTVPSNYTHNKGFHVIPKFQVGFRIGVCTHSRVSN
jgi:hypothetical protein